MFLNTEYDAEISYIIYGHLIADKYNHVYSYIGHELLEDKSSKLTIFLKNQADLPSIF